MTAGSLWPVAALLYGAAFWGFSWYPLRLLEGQGLSGAWLALVSYGAAFPLLLGMLRPDRAEMARHAGELVVLALAVGWANLAFLLAVLEGEVVRVILLFYLSPLWAALLGRLLLGEALTRVTAWMLLLGISGMVVVEWRPGVVGGGASNADWLALSSGMAFALGNVMIRRLSGLDIRTKTTVGWAGVLVLAGIGVFLTGASVPDAVPLAWGGAVLLGLAGFFVSTLCVVYGVSNMAVQRSAVILLFEILVGALTAWWLAGEPIGLREVLGGTLIVAAGLVAVMR